MAVTVPFTGPSSAACRQARAPTSSTVGDVAAAFLNQKPFTV